MTDPYGAMAHQRRGDLGIFGGSQYHESSQLPAYRLIPGPFGIVNDFWLASNGGQVLIGSGATIPAISALGTTFAVYESKSGSYVLGTFDLTVTGTGADSGAMRAVIRSLATGSNAIRAGEFQTLRGTAATANATWGIEIGVHSQVAGNGTTENLGAYIASSHSGWLSSGVRNDSGILITGEDGWTHGVRYLDTDGTTLLFDVDQVGNVILRGSPTASVGNLHIASAGNASDISLYSGNVTATFRHWQIATNYTAAGDFGIYRGTTGGAVPTTLALHLDSSSNLQLPAYGIGTATFDAAGNVTSVSDERKKNIVGSYKRGLTEVLQLKPIEYHWREDSGLSPHELNVGFSAQQVQPIIPEAIGQDAQGFLTFGDRAVLATCVNAIQELNAKVESLERKLEAVSG